MNFSNFSHNGGLPLTQERLDFLQQSYLAAFQAIAKLCGDKTILHGVVNDGGVVSDGWISYDGELLPFVGGAHDTGVVIVETATPFTFADATSHDVEFTRYATCGTPPDFDFADLVPLLSLVNMWMPGDIKQKVVDAAYEAANFDVDGYGINRETGWRILSKAYPASAGKVFVNKDDADADFDEVENTGGDKEHTLASAEQGSFAFKTKNDDIGGGGATVVAVVNVNGDDIAVGASNQAGYGATLTKKPQADATAHNNLQPYFVVLTVIKL